MLAVVEAEQTDSLVVLVEQVVVAQVTEVRPLGEPLQQGLQTWVVAVAVERAGMVLAPTAAPVSSSSSTPYLVKPSLYSKARLRGNVPLV